MPLVAGDSLVSGPGNRGTLDVSDTRSSDRLATFEGHHLVVAGSRSYLHSETELRALDRERFVKLNDERRGLSELLRQTEKIIRTESARRSGAVGRLRPHREQLAGELQRVSRELRDCVPWTTPCRHPLSLILAGATLFAGGRGEVGAYSTLDGRLVWTGKVEGDALGLAVADGRLLVSTDTGHIHAFRPAIDGPVAERAPGSDQPPRTDRDRVSDLARRILRTSGARQGFCLVIGGAPEQLAAALAHQSELTVIGVDEDIDRVRAGRAYLAAEGLYGERVALRALSSTSLPFTDYFANLIVVSERSLSRRPIVAASEVYRVLRPDGGVLVVEGAATPDGRKARREWVDESGLDGWSWSADRLTVFLRRGPLSGSGEWTHQYAGPGNTAASRDELVGPATRLQWFGGPGPRRMIDRHLRTVAPLYSRGRLFLPGNHQVICVDAYNGTELWEAEVPGSRRVGAPYDASYMAASGDTLYVAAAGTCRAIDVRTGRPTRTFQVPARAGSEADERHWGYVATVGDALFGSGQRTTASRRHMSREEVVDQYREFRPLVTSDSLFCFDRTSGALRWRRDGGSIVNNTLTIGGGRIYFVESRAPPDGVEEGGGGSGRRSSQAGYASRGRRSPRGAGCRDGECPLGAAVRLRLFPPHPLPLLRG